MSADSKGGRGVGGTFQAGIGRESREITLKNARKKIVALAQQLRLRPDHIDMSFYFFKLALARHLTRGRKSTHVIAACVYITCRTEGTSHMLIDFSDIMQIDVYELGRTYLRLSQALCINIPAMDPCLYVMRFAHKLEFDDKTHEVSMTALRLVSRMKKDWIHFGRRPSGLCGAALLIASRLHNFSRSVSDVIKVVKVHESTLRKRLNEFGETPASQLTLEEFMNIDLDAMTEEQDPPSFKAARKRDRERLTQLEEEEDLDKELSDLQIQIEKEMEDRKVRVKGKRGSRESTPLSESPGSSDTEDGNQEDRDTQRFINEETLGVISECLEGKVIESSQEELDSLLMPPPGMTPARHVMSTSIQEMSPGLGLKDTVQEYLMSSTKDDESNDEESDDDKDDKNCELDLEGIDDDEISSYIMSDNEIRLKTNLWMKVNEEYLKEQAEKEERERKEIEEMIAAGIEPTKKRKVYKKKNKNNHQENGTAIEAIKKVVQEKKISTKINYDVLKSLNFGFKSPSESGSESDTGSVFGESGLRTPSGISDVQRGCDLTSPLLSASTSDTGLKRPAGLSYTTSAAKIPKTEPGSTRAKIQPNLGIRGRVKEKEEKLEPVIETGPVIVESGPVSAAATEDDDDDYEDEDDDMSAAQLLSKHMGMGEEYGEEEDYY